MRALFPLICCVGLGSSSNGQSSDWLEGRWAVDGESCDAAWLTYRADGTWSDFLNRGTWRREGLNLGTSMTHDAPQLPGYEARPVAHPLCHRERLERIGEDELRTTWEDDSFHRLVRCHPTEITYPHTGCLGDCERVTPFDPHPWNTGPPDATRLCSP